jgi:hypothetical protein
VGGEVQTLNHFPLPIPCWTCLLTLLLFYLFIYLEVGSQCVAQAGLKLLDISDPLASASGVAGLTMGSTIYLAPSPSQISSDLCSVIN